MKDSRIGEALWFEWDGLDYEFSLKAAEMAFYTHDHVDLETEVVKRALASTLQRDGLVSSLGQAFSVLDQTSALVHGYLGFVDEEIIPVVCDKDGFTSTGEEVLQSIPATWVEVWLPWN